jgi:hypothetical protein
MQAPPKYNWEKHLLDALFVGMVLVSLSGLIYVFTRR